MGPVVRSLILKGFRSVRAGQIVFDNPTFLVGRNGSGKSNIADAFAFLSEAMASPLQEVFDRRGGIGNVITKTSENIPFTNLGIAVELSLPDSIKAVATHMSGDIESARYAFEVRALPDYKFEIAREQCILTLADGKRQWFNREQNAFTANVEPFNKINLGWGPSNLAMPLIAGIFPFLIVAYVLKSMRVYSIEPAKLRDMQDPDSGTGLRSDGANAASVFELIKRDSPEAIQRIGEFLSAIVPNTKIIDTIQHGKKIALEFAQEWEVGKKLGFEAFSMSDGTLRAFGLLLAVFQHETPSVIVVEEPEASLHPAAAGVVLDMLREAAKKMQVIVSTHSPEILDANWIDDKHLRVVHWQKGVTSVSRVSEMSRKALQDHLMQAGELMRSEALEPDPLFEDAPEKQANLFEEVV
jgi:predicted ATPase